MADARDMLTQETSRPSSAQVSSRCRLSRAAVSGMRTCSSSSPAPTCKSLRSIREKILEKMKTIPDAVDVDTTLIAGKPELQLEVDRDTAADLGVRVGDVSQALNTLVAGQQATTYNEGTDQYDVYVRAINSFRTSVEGLKTRYRTFRQSSDGSHSTVW